MIQKVLFFLSLVLACLSTLAQDTTKLETLEKKHIRVCLGDPKEIKPILIRSASYQIIGFDSPETGTSLDTLKLKDYSGISMVPVLNSIPGTRMEERSPGSYRLSLRGSLLRSPFGIRNIKIYIGDHPFTDGGGNTYLNLIAPEAIERISVFRGPDGSRYGANSGGVVRLNLIGTWKTEGSASVKIGSYGLFNENLSYKLATEKNLFVIKHSWLKSDGYRENSAMDRQYFQLSDQWNYNEWGTLTSNFLYSDLFYQTPGGLTKTQYESDPGSARPATASLPGAVTQRAGIRNKTAFAGINHFRRFDGWLRRLTHTLSINGSLTDFENPFITNYEERKERTGAARTQFTRRQGSGNGNVDWDVSAGLEVSSTHSDISNFGNRAGLKDSVQAIDELNNTQQSYFVNSSLHVYDKFLLEGAISYNLSSFRVSRSQPISLPEERRIFEPTYMPRIAGIYSFNEYLNFRASVSKGYSPPTLAEIRSSNIFINTALQAEMGWNREVGFRLRNKKNTFSVDIAAFYFTLNQAIARRLNDAGQEYFVNAGGTLQKGIEAAIDWTIFEFNEHPRLKRLSFNSSITLSDFRFTNYINPSTDLSGKSLTGVPKQVIVTSISALFPYRISLFIQHNYTSKLPMLDDGSVSADAYNLLIGKLSWETSISQKLTLISSLGIDNALNEKYSLGNDLNAAGGRYYNAAPPRNYWFGLTLRF